MKRIAIAHIMLSCLLLFSAVQPKESTLAYNVSRAATIVGLSGIALSGINLYKNNRQLKKKSVVTRDVAVPLASVAPRRMAVGPRGHISNMPTPNHQLIIQKPESSKKSPAQDQKNTIIRQKNLFWWRAFITSAIAAALGGVSWWQTKPVKVAPSVSPVITPEDGRRLLTVANDVAVVDIAPYPTGGAHVSTQTDPIVKEKPRVETPIISPPHIPMPAPEPLSQQQKKKKKRKPRPKGPLPHGPPPSRDAPVVLPSPQIKSPPEVVRVTLFPKPTPPKSDWDPEEHKRHQARLASMQKVHKEDVLLPMSVASAYQFLRKGEKRHLYDEGAYKANALKSLSPTWRKLIGKDGIVVISEPGKTHGASWARRLVSISKLSTGAYNIRTYDYRVTDRSRIVLEKEVSGGDMIALKIFKQPRSSAFGSTPEIIAGKYKDFVASIQSSINEHAKTARALGVHAAQVERDLARETAKKEYLAGTAGARALAARQAERERREAGLFSRESSRRSSVSSQRRAPVCYQLPGGPPAGSPNMVVTGSMNRLATQLAATQRSGGKPPTGRRK